MILFLALFVFFVILPTIAMGVVTGFRTIKPEEFERITEYVANAKQNGFSPKMMYVMGDPYGIDFITDETSFCLAWPTLLWNRYDITLTDARHIHVPMWSPMAKVIRDKFATFKPTRPENYL